jgi:hypothetical protein
VVIDREVYPEKPPVMDLPTNIMFREAFPNSLLLARILATRDAIAVVFSVLYDLVLHQMLQSNCGYKPSHQHARGVFCKSSMSNFNLLFASPELTDSRYCSAIFQESVFCRSSRPPTTNYLVRLIK